MLGDAFNGQKECPVQSIGFLSVFSPPTARLYLCTKKSSAMATNITNSFATIYLSSHLPENVYVATDAQSIVFTVSVEGDDVFTSVYYPYNNMVCVRDIRSIVEDAMFEQDLNIATLVLEAREGSGASSVIDDVRVICSDFKTTIATETFLRRNFLTTRKSALVPNDGWVDLHSYIKAFERENQYANIYYTLPFRPDMIMSYTLNMEEVLIETDGIVMKTLTKQYLENLMWETYERRCVVGVEYHIGNRSFNVFFTDERPSDVFSFLNAFNIPERAYLYGATTTKTEVNRSEAVIGRKTLFYDETVTVKHEVETGPMTYDEAMWLSQMFASRWVNRILPNNKSAEILISDISSEVTDSNKELMKLKFSWKYAEGTEWNYNEITRI